MLRIDDLKLRPGEDTAALRKKAARALGVRPGDITELTVLRRSLDARGEPRFVYSVAAAVRGEARLIRRGAAAWRPEVYALPERRSAGAPPRPVVVGAGPAGLFAALVLAECGMPPILLERGKPVEQRREDVERFFRTGVLDESSNVQFGEGGAGAFSDGKLNTGTRDVRHRFILETLAACGAPEEILYDARPHVGTDRLFTVLQSLRARLLALGTELRFSHTLTGIETEAGALAALTVAAPEGTYTLPCRSCVLAPGHSAGDTMAALHRCGVPMEPKPFAVGVRIEHPQAALDSRQYGQYAGHPGLPPTSYKLSCHLPGGRSVFSFCVCPGGQVVAAASRGGGVVTNGMSLYARDGENINGGLLVNVTPEDYGGTAEDPLAGYRWQRRWEEAAWNLGGGGYFAPAQRVEDFLLGRPSAGGGAVRPSYRPGVAWGDVRRCLPDFVADALAEALPLLDEKLPGFAAPDAVLTAVESRSSSPVRLPRDETYQSAVGGLYPCGEGAGYAGGILSAAADGMRCAEALLGRLA